ncbi:MAG: DNA gyrase subunit A [Bacteroidales bacterium]|nr:DNA gyrase subunit A [Bacteroidales bacterium]
MSDGERIIQVNIENQMKTAYIDYSMSVIVARALPDARDGMKPVHRRILYAMWDQGILAGRPHKKSARIVGEVLGKYHPHGDTAVYDAMVRMAQDWSMRLPYVDGQGNFGSVDGDGAAAMRYTEARLRKCAEELLNDIEKDTVDMRKNFSEEFDEPTVLPAKIPALLVNGSSGIAVGMATNMAPHNLGEVCDGIIAYIDNNDITIEELMHYIKGPDFPSGCAIYGYDGVRSAFTTGRGRVIMRGDATIEDEGTKPRIIVTSLPYLVGPSELISHTAELVKEGKIDGIANIENLSNKRNGTRIVYELKRDAIPNVVLNKLYQLTALQSSFSINNVALVNGRPETLNLKQLIECYVKHRHEVIIRRAQFELRKAEERAHILEGLLKALDIIDEIIAAIRASQSVDDARTTLMERWAFTEIQARAIVEMRLRQLTGLEREKLQNEFDELQKQIEYLRRVLAEYSLQMQIIKDELTELKAKYGDERRSHINYQTADFRIEDNYADTDMAITVSHLGYIKRTSLSEYKSQARGGRGSRGSSSREADFTEQLYIANNHHYLLFFTEKGRCYWLRVFEIPEGPKAFKGRAVQNLLQLDPDDKIKAIINVKDLKDEEYCASHYIIMCTEKGIVKKTSLASYSRPRAMGIIAINIREDDHLVNAQLTAGDDELLLAGHSGKAVRFHESTVRAVGRDSMGVRGITLADESDYVIGMVCLESPNDNILVVSEKGFGKRSLLEDYRITNRGGKGVKTLNITEKTGGLIAIQRVTDEDDLMIINRSGIAIRLHVDTLRVLGRATQGVKLINLGEKDMIAAVSRVPREEEEPEEGEEVTDETVVDVENETPATEENVQPDENE